MIKKDTRAAENLALALQTFDTQKSHEVRIVNEYGVLSLLQL
jgi:hypothetical protein